MEFFPCNPHITAEEKESTLRLNYFSEMYSVRSTRLLRLLRLLLTALPFSVWGSNEIIKCWKRDFQLFFQLGNLCCQCTFATTPLLLLLSNLTNLKQHQISAKLFRLLHKVSLIHYSSFYSYDDYCVNLALLTNIWWPLRVNSAGNCEPVLPRKTAL